MVPVASASVAIIVMIRNGDDAVGDEQDCADDTQANGCRGRKVEDSTEHYEYRSDSQHDRATQQDRQGIVVTSWNKNPNSNGDEG